MTLREFHRHHRRATSLLAAVVALTASAGAQRLVVRNFTESDGMPGSSVSDVQEAPDGRILFATRTGLHAFDGTSWEELYQDALPPGRAVRYVRFDGDGHPWMLCLNGRLLHGVGDRAVPSPPLANDRDLGQVTDFAVLGRDPEVRLLLSTALLGLNLWTGAGWVRVTLDGEPVGAVPVEVFDGRAYFGDAGGLSTVDAAGVATRVDVPGLPAGAVRGLTADRDQQRLLILGDGWAGVLASDGGFAIVADGLPEPRVFDEFPVAVVGDGHGGFLFGNGVSLFHHDASTGLVERLDRADGLVGDGVHSLMRDRHGMLWGATALGAFRLLGFGVRVHTAADGLAEDEVTAIASLADGRIVLGHHGQLSIQDTDGWRTITFEGRDPNVPSFARVMDLTLARDGSLWIAAAGRGLGRLDANDELTWFGEPGDAERWANSVHQAADGTILLGTPSGLFRVVGTQLERLPHGDAEGLFVRRVEVGADGTLYLATTRGLKISRRGRWTTAVGNPGPDELNHHFTVFEDHAERVWVGAADGLWLLDGDRLRRAGPTRDVRRPVYSLTEDERGRLWIGTDFGFLRSDEERLLPLDWMAEITGRETNRAAALRDRRGSVWMGTTSGVSVFRPSFDLPSGPPAVTLLALETRDGSLDPSESLRLDSQASDLRLRARALVPFAEGHVEWRYRVVDFTDWVERTGPTVLDERFTGLPPGEYRFEVQARVPGGRFSEVVSSAGIDVLGPVWTRWWFLVLAVLVSGTLTLGVYRALTTRRHALRLQREVEARTRELESSLQELAKTDRLRSLGMLAGGIAHDFRNVLTALTGNLSLLRLEVEGDPELVQYVDEADRALQRAEQLSSQLQTFATGGEPVTRAVSVEAVARDCAALILSGSRISAEIEFDEGVWPAEADEGQLRQVFENLIVNAREFQVDGGWIRLRGQNVELDDGTGPERLAAGRYVQVVVTDGGPGVPESVRHHVFDPFFTTKATGSGLGLATSRSIVERHGGRLDLEAPRAARPGSDGRSETGARFRLLLPASRASVETVPVAEAPVATDGEGSRVLVLDDEAAVRRTLRRMLERLGFAVEETESCGAAEQAVREACARGRPFSCAVLDLTLPGGPSGAEVLERLRRIDPDLSAAASSGYSADPVLARPVDFGFQTALPKPYRLAALVSTMRLLVPGRRD